MSDDSVLPFTVHRTRWFVPPGRNGWTLGSHIFIRANVFDVPDSLTYRRLLRHEVVHVRQYAEVGVPRFLAIYLWSYLKNLVLLRNHHEAYRAIPFEVEARRETG